MICGADVSARGAARVDHIKPRSRYPELAWSLDNLRTLCSGCDNQSHREKAMPGYRGERIERVVIRGFDRHGVPLDPNYNTVPSRGETHPDWLRPAVIPLTIVCGAPCSGKTTWVTEQAGPHDLVIDLDQIAGSLSGHAGHNWDRRAWLEPAMARRNELLAAIGGPCRWPRAWLIVSEPTAERRDWWRRRLRPERVVVLKPPMEVCLARLAQRGGGDRRAIERWFLMYRELPTDTVIA